MKKSPNDPVTKKDIEKLGQKIDSGFKKLDQRIDYLQKDITKSFKTVLEIIGDTNTRIDEALKRIDKHGDRIDDQGKRQDAILEELRSNRIVLGSHENRLQKVEFKVFPQ